MKKIDNNIGAYIIINGADGGGKTTQEKRLLEKNPHWKVIKEPGGTVLGEIIRSILLDEEPIEAKIEKLDSCFPHINKDVSIAMMWYRAKKELEAEGLSPKAEVYLYALSRLWSTRQIKQWVEEGHVVIATRSVACSFAYQGAGRKLGMDLIHTVNGESMGLISPTAEIFLSVPVEIGKERTVQRGEENRFDKESTKFFARVLDGYMSYYQNYATHPVHVVDANRKLGEVGQDIEEILGKYL